MLKAFLNFSRVVMRKHSVKKTLPFRERHSKKRNQTVVDSNIQLEPCPFSQAARLAGVELISCREIVFYANAMHIYGLSLPELDLKSFQTCR